MATQSPSSLLNLNYPGANRFALQDPGGQNVFTPVWPDDYQAQMLKLDQDNQQRVAELLDQITCIQYYADVPIPFTGVASEIVQSRYQGITNPVIWSAAQTDVSVGSVQINVNSLNQNLMQDPCLITSVAASANDANRFAWWPQPLFVPPSTQISFQWTNDANNPSAAGTFSMIGRAVKPGSPSADVQELINRLNNLPYWININIPFTSTANESRGAAYQGIANPTVILGAQTNLELGTVLPFVQPLSSQLSKDAIRLLSFAGLSGAIQPFAWFPQPMVIPPNQVMNFTFTNDATTPQAAGQLTLLARLLRYNN